MNRNKIADYISNYLERYTRGKLSVWVFLSDLIFVPIGWTFLLLKYRDTKKITAIKLNKYDDSYSVAGRTVVLQSFLVLLGLLVLGLLIAGIIGTIKNN